MITKMHIENFKCFKDFDIDLGPFNVLIGPNDSGKTAFLQAVGLLAGTCQVGPFPMGSVMPELGIQLEKSDVWQGKGDLEPMIRASVSSEEPKTDWIIDVSSTPQGKHRVVGRVGDIPVDRNQALDAIRAAISAKLLDFDPSALRKNTAISGPVQVFSDFTDAPRWHVSPAGEGLPTFLEDLLRADRQRFFSFENTFYRRFPHYKRLDVVKEGGNNAIKFVTRSGQELSATAVSDGTMLYLGFLAMSYHPSPPAILLVEEPENGVHHAGLQNIVSALKSLSEDRKVQVIATTHSPYLLDLVEPEEVRVFSKDEEGAVHAAKLSDYPEVAKLRKHFMTGELWTEFDEADIVKGTGGGKK